MADPTRQSLPVPDIPDRLARLHDVALALSRALTADEVADVIVSHAVPAVGANVGVVSVLTEDGTALVALRISGYPPEMVQPWQRIPADGPYFLADAVRDRAPIVLGSYAERIRRYPHRADVRAIGGDGAGVAVPLLLGERPIGVLGLSFPTDRSFSPDDIAFVEIVARQCAQALERARLSDAAHRELAERVHAQAALLESERRYRELWENANDILYTLDLDGNLTDLNRRGEQLTGYSRAELLGTPIYRLVLPEYHERMQGMLVRKEAGEPVTTYELEIRAKDGRRVALEVSSRLIARDGAPAGIQGSARDITERRQAQQEIARLYRDAQDALRVRDDFLASISHDLRSPLATVKGLSQLVLRQARRAGTPESHLLIEQLTDIEDAAATMNALIDDLLDLARLDTGRPLDLDLQATDLVALARRVAAGQQKGTGRHHIRVEAPEAAVEGWWDAGRLERVLANLLSNAVKYSPDGGEIVVTVTREAGTSIGRELPAFDARPPAPAPRAILTVRDHGLGIPAADLPHIFDRFYRGTNVAGRIKGTGIGLAGARQIVEQHGGTLAADSVEGRGSTFTVRLPLGGRAAPVEGD